jgi:hypothetical protein
MVTALETFARDVMTFAMGFVIGYYGTRLLDYLLDSVKKHRNR